MAEDVRISFSVLRAGDGEPTVSLIPLTRFYKMGCKRPINLPFTISCILFRILSPFIPVRSCLEFLGRRCGESEEERQIRQKVQT